MQQQPAGQLQLRTHCRQRAASNVPSLNNSLQPKRSSPVRPSRTPFVLDTSATYCMSPDPSQFINLQLYSNNNSHELSGIANCHGCRILGKGTLAFQVCDNKGNWQTVLVPNSMYVPDLQQVLISPQHWMSTDKSVHVQIHQ